MDSFIICPHCGEKIGPGFEHLGEKFIKDMRKIGVKTANHDHIDLG